LLRIVYIIGRIFGVRSAYSSESIELYVNLFDDLSTVPIVPHVSSIFMIVQC